VRFRHHRSRPPRLLVNSYSRLVLHNASVARFEQVANADGAVVDTFTIVQTRTNRSAPFPCFFNRSSSGGVV
jgi:hypothetical protein